jgi:hypothetical protein
MRSGSAYLLLWFVMLSGACRLVAQEKVTRIPAGGTDDLFELGCQQHCFSFHAAISAFYIQRSAGSPETLEITIPGYVSTGGETGQPALPLRSVLFEAAGEARPRIRIVHMDSAVIDLGDRGFEGRIATVKPSMRKHQTPEEIRSAQEATVDEWTETPVLAIDYGGILRGVPVSTLHFCPVRYHPGTNRIKIYYNVDAVIEPREAVTSREIPSVAFSSVFRRIVRQQDGTAKKAVFSEEPMTLVILSDTMFRHSLQPLVRWKTEKGFRVVEAYMQDPEIGDSRESIRAFLKGMYFSPPPGIAPTTYLLIVGDVQQVPLSQSAGEITDLYYAAYDGEGDYIPDVFYGRISVALPGQLQAVLDKILGYEQYRFSDASFLDEAVLIAGVDGTYADTHGNGQINYARNLYFNDSSGINAHTFLYPESDTCDQLILDLISGGVGFVNYTGHGLYDRWINPTFRQDDIPDLLNSGKYPVMIGNGCETNIYTLDECFAEALVRSEGKGALAYIGCTSDSYWDEDYYWSVGVGPVVPDPGYGQTSLGFYDRTFHLHGEPREQWTPSLGEMVFGGNLAVQESNSSRKKFYWEIYQLMGDPSLVPWFGRPGTRDIRFPEILPPGSERLDITCAPFDYIALSLNGQLLDATHSGPQGFATLELPDTLTGDSMDLVVTGDRFRPFTGKVMIGVPELPYLDLLEYGISGESDEEDHLICPDESFSLSLVLVNRGATVLEEDTLVLRTGHPGITIPDPMILLADLRPGDTLVVPEAFRILAGHDVQDQESFSLVMQRKGDALRRNIFLKEVIDAPVLVSGGIRWDDRPHGNGNGIAEGGEILSCEWELSNRGHYRTEAINGWEVPGDTTLFIETGFPAISSLETGQTGIYRFTARLVPTAGGTLHAGPFGAGDSYISVRDSFTLTIDRHFEDFTGGIPGKYPFINDSVSPWREERDGFSSSPVSLRSGPVPNYGSSEVTVRFETDYTDTLSFSFRVSSETGYDFLHLYADSAEVARWSGERVWERYTCPVGPGSHEITWAYRKDQSISRGADAAWIDDVVFPSSSFRRQDLSLVEILHPRSGPWLGTQEAPELRIRNTGMEPVTELAAMVSIGEGIALRDSLKVSLQPGAETQIHPGGTLDLSGFGTYTLHAEVYATGDRFPGNNTLEHMVRHYEFPDLGLSMVGIDSVDGISADAVISLENLGNTRFDSVAYELVVDGAVTDSGVRYIGLEPGGLVDETFRLHDSLAGELHTGIHAFGVRSIVPDSVQANNRVSGLFYWHALGLDRERKPVGLSLYPNPASEGFYLVLTTPAPEVLTLRLFGQSGKVVGSYVIPVGADRIYIGTGLPPGHYLLQCVETGTTLHLVKPE